eukprot:18966-Heterococcus_DN1.PRE.2
MSSFASAKEDVSAFYARICRQFDEPRTVDMLENHFSVRPLAGASDVCEYPLLSSPKCWFRASHSSAIWPYLRLIGSAIPSRTTLSSLQFTSALSMHCESIALWILLTVHPSGLYAVSFLYNAAQEAVQEGCHSGRCPQTQRGDSDPGAQEQEG